MGFYVIENIWSSCRSWRANLRTHLGEQTGGSPNCMSSVNRGASRNMTQTLFAKVVELQKDMVSKRNPIPGLNHIDFHGQGPKTRDGRDTSRAN